MSSPPPSKRARHEFGLMRPNGDSFVGSASGIHFVQTVYKAVSKTDLPQQIVPGEDDQLPQGSCDTILWRMNELSEPSGAPTQLQNLLEWSQNYFDNWHPAFPFLHAPTVVEWLSDLCNSTISTVSSNLRPTQLTIVRSIMSISLADGRQLGHRVQLPPAIVFRSYDEAIQSMRLVLVGRPSIESLQAALSIELFLISMLRLNGASRIHGVVLRLIFQMGLHRCPRRFSAFDAAEADIRQRILWIAYVFDRHLSQCLGLPVTLRDDDIDVCLLGNEQHTLNDNTGLKMDDRLVFSMFIARHARLKGQVIELCNKNISHRSFDGGQFQDLGTKVEKWTNDLEEFIQCNASQAPVFIHTQQATLDVLKHEITLSLNRPLLTAPKSSSEYRAAMQQCIKASRALISNLYGIFCSNNHESEQMKEHDADAKNLMTWPFLTWSIWMSAFFVIFAATEKEVSQLSAVKLSDESIEILKHLSTRGSVWPGACDAAIRDLSAPLRPSQRLHGSPHAPGLPTNASNIENASITENIPATNRDNSQRPHRESSSGIHPANPTQSVGSNTDTAAILNEDNVGGLLVDPLLSSAGNLEQTDISLFEGFDLPFWLDDDALADVWTGT